MQHAWVSSVPRTMTRILLLLVALPLFPSLPAQTERANVSTAGVEADARVLGLALSFDGRRVAFASAAGNLVPGDTNQEHDVFVRDLNSRTTTRVSLSATGGELAYGSLFPAISGDGQMVAFLTVAEGVVHTPGNGFPQVYVRDLRNGQAARASVDDLGVPAHGFYGALCLSHDGRFVAFQSSASDLVAGDTNQADDVFVHDLVLHTTRRVSIATGGAQGIGASTKACIAADGRKVAFASTAINLVPGDTNFSEDVFVHDRTTATTIRASVDAAGRQSRSASGWPAISGDGRQVAFAAAGDDLVPGDRNGVSDILVKDLGTGAVELVSVATDTHAAEQPSITPSLSVDGRFVAFMSQAYTLVPGDMNLASDVFLRDRWARSTIRVSLASSGSEGNRDSYLPVLSGNTSTVVFVSHATNLVTNDNNRVEDAFVRDVHAAYQTTYGTGCKGATGYPQVYTLGNPVLGTPVWPVGLSQAAGNTPVLLAIAGTADALGFGTGCALLVGPPWLTVPELTTPGGVAAHAFAVPNQPELAGRSVFCQWIVLDPLAPYGLAFSNGLQAVVGR